MKVLAVLLALAATCLYVQAQNVVCGKGTSSKTVTIEDGESYSFKTHKGKKYKGNTECTVDYKMGDTCAEMSFACTKFNTNNKDKKKCKKGDMVTITANGKAKAYCKTKKPKVTSSGDMQVVFSSDAKKHSSGAVCKVTCTEAASTTATTTEAAGGGGAGNCPRERPEVNSPCDSSEDRSRCEYGTQTCCGENFPDFVMECMEDTWAGVQVETPCFSGATCGPVTANCPRERPEFNSPCNSSEDSPRCEYGNQTCCGESFPEIAMECMEDTWAGIAVQTPCFFQGHSCGPVTILPPQNCICPEIYEPVCGTNGQTYSNTCFARCEAQTAACEGECPCTSDCICLAVYDPVCGTNGQTYSNTCQAGCANAGVACEGECPCTSDCICLAVFSPVCGGDGQTYSNSCEAKCVNAGVGCEGECPCA